MFLYTIKKWLRKQENLIIEILGIIFALGIFLVCLYLYIKGITDLLTFIEYIVTLALVIGPIYLYLAKKREQILILGLSSKFFIEQDESKIDDLLGLLIAGKWEKLKIDPIEEFFNTLINLCYRGECETRRRIAEALPALFKLDIVESERLVEVLRHDWDEDRWKGDNRRRTIESLYFIINKNKKLVKKCLQLIDGDDIYVVLSIIELLDAWAEKNNKKQAEKLFSLLISQMENMGFSPDEKQAAVDLWSLLKLTHSDPKAAAARIYELKGTANIYLQISISRNIRRLCRCFPKCNKKPLCEGVPQRILELMEFFLQENKAKNVRRPIAKEQSLACLITLMKYRSFRDKSKKIIMMLLTDKDDIIRFAAFDKIDNILDSDPGFALEILQLMKQKEQNPKLVERVNRISQRITN